MIAVDTNILIYAHRGELPWHDRAAARLREVAEGSSPWVIPWPCIHEFLAVVSNPRAFRTPTPLSRLLQQVEVWMQSPSCIVAGEGSEHWRRLTELIETGKISGGAVHDAKVAAICLDHGVSVLWTADRDFSRFPIRTANPLLGD